MRHDPSGFMLMVGFLEDFLTRTNSAIIYMQITSYQPQATS